MERTAPDGAAPGSEWFNLVAERSGLIFFVMRIRPDVAFEYISSALPERLGVPVAAALADPRYVLERIEPDSQSRFAASLEMEPGQEETMDLTWRHHDGHLVHSRASMRASGRPDGSVVQEGVVLDITELRQLETELRQSEERYRLIVENAYDVIWTMELDGSITYVSPSVQRVRGISPAEAMTQSLEQIHPPTTAASVTAYFERLFAAIAAGAEPPIFRGEHEYYRKDGSIMTGELQVIPHVGADGKVVEILGVTRDISARKVFEAELTEMAVTDPVTGLWNRRHTTVLLADDLERSQTLTVLMIDIDHFKAINDNHGHQAGDQVLTEVGRRLREQIRQTDVVGRWGGEEFVVLLRDCGLADSLAMAEKLRHAIADGPFGSAGSVSVSIGAAELADGEELGSLLDRADAALYRAKRAGRNTVIAG